MFNTRGDVITRSLLQSQRIHGFHVVHEEPFTQLVRSRLSSYQYLEAQEHNYDCQHSSRVDYGEAEGVVSVLFEEDTERPVLEQRHVAVP